MPHRLTYLRATGRRAANALRVCRGAKNPDANTVAVMLFTHASCLDSTREGALEKPSSPGENHAQYYTYRLSPPSMSVNTNCPVDLARNAMTRECSQCFSATNAKFTCLALSNSRLNLIRGTTGAL